jgi:hypothetical protein
MSTNNKFPLRLVPKDDLSDDPMFAASPSPTIFEQAEADAAALLARRGGLTKLDPKIAKAIAQGEVNTRAWRATERDEATAPDKGESYPPPTSSAELASTPYPALAYTVDKLVMDGRPQTLDGDGGIGKSNVAAGMAVARAAGKPIFGRATIQGPALFVTHEDDLSDLQGIAQGYADYIDADLAALPVEWWSLLENDITLAVVNDDGAWKPGPFYKTFEAKLRASPRGLFVVLDCRSDVVQMNEVLREPPNTFYKTVLTPLCKRYGCTILVLCHPSKASMSDGSYYSGGTGNKSALRNKLVMKLADESPDADPLGPRVLDVLKRNRGTREKTGVRLTFDPLREIYVADDDEAVQGDKRAMYELVVKAVLELIDKGIRVVRSARGDGYSPKDVAGYINRERKPVKPITRRQVEALLKLAQECGALVYVEGRSKTKAGYAAGGVE